MHGAKIEQSPTLAPSRRRLRVAVIVATMCASTVLISVSPTPGAAATAPAGALSMGIPAYFYPAGAGLASWDQLRSITPAAGTVIATGLRLESTAPDTNYQQQVRMTRAAGSQVLAYVTTSGGDRAPATVKAEIDRAFAWYDVDGVFFDEGVRYPVTCGQVDYYRSLSDYAKARKPGATTVVNHGQILPECYADVADILMIAEMAAADYRSSWRPWGWEHNYPPEKFWHLVHSTPGITEMQETVRLGKSRNAGRIFVTSAGLGSPGGPYGSLPTAEYLAAEVRALAEALVTTTSSTAPAPFTSTTQVAPTTTSTALPASSTTTTAPVSRKPVVSSFTPTAGPPGTTVRLFGSGLAGVTMVTLNGGPVKIVAKTETTLTVTLNSWNTSGTFWLSAPGGVSFTTTGRFTVIR